MALLVKTNPREKLPDDAILLTEEQAIKYQLKVIDGWKESGEVWALRLGPAILGSMSVASGVFINNHFRRKLKLGAYGRFSTYLPIVIIPAIMTTLFHKTMVQSDVLLKRYNCPTCLQTRAAALQAGFGVVYPFILGPVASFMFATRHFTYRLPSVTENPKEVFKLWMKLTKSASTTGTAFLVINLFAGMFITYREMTEHYALNLKLAELEDKLGPMI